MRNFLHHIIADQRGALSFEWILITTLLVVGIVGGMAAVRDAFIVTYGSGAQAATALDQNFSSPDNTYGSFTNNSVYKEKPTTPDGKNNVGKWEINPGIAPPHTTTYP